MILKPWQLTELIVPLECCSYCTAFSALLSAMFGMGTGSERKMLKSSPGGRPIILYCAETIPSPSTRSTLLSKLEKLFPSHWSFPRSSINCSILSWNGSSWASLQATLLFPTCETYLKRSVFLNDGWCARVLGMLDFRNKGKKITIAHTKVVVTNNIRIRCNRNLNGSLKTFMAIISNNWNFSNGSNRNSSLESLMSWLSFTSSGTKFRSN